jgi:hypothetical protein
VKLVVGIKVESGCRYLKFYVRASQGSGINWHNPAMKLKKTGEVGVLPAESANKGAIDYYEQALIFG